MIIQSYIKTALRSLWRDRFYAILNIVGLALGLACCLLIWIYRSHELSYDRFHEDANRIYRMNMDLKLGEQELVDAITNVNLGPALKEKIASVQDYNRIYSGGMSIVQVPDAEGGADRPFSESEWLVVDENFFDFFDFPLIAGDPGQVLAKPNALVLTEETMQRYFGSSAQPADVIGKTLLFGVEKTPYTITGIMANVPSYSHLQFSFLASLVTEKWMFENPSWGNNNVFTYIKIHPDIDSPNELADLQLQINDITGMKLSKMIEDFSGASYASFLAEGNHWNFVLYPMLDLHLNSTLTHEQQPPGNKNYLQIFTAVALFILLLACINYMNLATARSANRALEVGIRKVMGAYRRQIIGQFMAESLVNTLVAAFIAIALAYYGLPAFNALTKVSIPFPWQDLSLWLALLLLVVVTAVMAGAYPAFYLSNFAPVRVLKGKLASATKNSFLRNTLVVLQFAVSIMLIISSIVVNRQVNYMLDRDAGFEKENLLVIKNTDMLHEQTAYFKDQVKQLAGVSQAAYVNAVPSQEELNGSGYSLKGEKPSHVMWMFQGDEDMFATLGLRLKHGRLLSEDIASDSAAVVLNEEGLRRIGGSKAINEEISFAGDQTYLTVVGSVENFTFRNLRQVIEAVGFFIAPQEDKQLAVRLSTADQQQILAGIEERWHNIAPEVPFEYFFTEDSYGKMFEQEASMRNFMQVGTLLAIFIACLGLLGLSAFSLQQRRKEISIRKVLGASTFQILLALTKETFGLIVVACLLAVPLAYWGMDRWLQQFVVRIDIPFDVFLVATGLALLIAIITISYQTLRAAVQDPAPALKENG